MTRSRDLLVTASATALAIGVAVLVGLGGWPGAASGCIAAGDCSCEAIRGGLVAQPATTYSNVVFLAAGFWLLRRAARVGVAGRPMAHRPLTLLLAGIVIFIGFGSGLFHASVTEWAGWLDLMGAAAFLTFFVLHEAALVLGEDHRWIVRRWTLAIAGLGGALWFLDNGAGKFVLAPLFVAALVLNRIVVRRGATPRPERWFWAGLGLYGAGAIVMELSRTGRPWCDPSSLLQPHAAWHGLAALAIVCFALYLRGEPVTRR